MSPVYYVAAGQETDGEPAAGYYFVKDGEPSGPYTTRARAMDAWVAWTKEAPQPAGRQEPGVRKADPVREALAELVACKEMREEISRRKQRRACSMIRNPIEVRAVAELHEAWKVRDCRAWNEARRCLGAAATDERTNRPGARP